MVNRVSGQIRNATTKVGIRDVIVAFYDLDIDKATQDFSTLEDTSISAFERYIALLYLGSDSEEDEILRGRQPRGDKLGSVVTDQAGRFSIGFDDAAFQRSDEEQRPDLVLIVSAPDRTLSENSLEAFPVGTPELQRLLHISFTPARNIGRQEEFIIDISPSLLERQNVELDEYAFGST